MDMTGEKNEGKKTAHCNRYEAYTHLKKHFIDIRLFRRDVQMAVIEEHSGILLMNFTISELIFLCK